MSGGPRTYLITGATGFVGKLLLEALLRRRDEIDLERVYAIVRPQGVAAASRFRRGVERSPCLAHLPPGWRERVEVLEGDLSRPGCGLADDAATRLSERVTHVIHAAAAVDFDLPLPEATASNVTATLHLLDLARRCRRLERLVSVSTAYVTPHPGDGIPIDERLAPLPEPASALYEAILAGAAGEAELLARSGHPNTYTFTKSLAEHLTLERAGDLPLAVVRPSIISATWRRPFPGWIDSPAAFAGFVALIGSGYLRAVVGDPDTRLNLVPADWVVERLVAASLTPATDAPEFHHAVAGGDHTPSIAECRESILGFFRSNPAGRRAAVRYLGPPGPRFRVADRLHNQAPVRLGMLVSRSARGRGRRLLSRLGEINRIFPYFTQRTFAFRSSLPFDEPSFDRCQYLSLVCEGVARHLLRSAPAPSAAAQPPA